MPPDIKSSSTPVAPIETNMASASAPSRSHGSLIIVIIAVLVIGTLFVIFTIVQLGNQPVQTFIPQEAGSQQTPSTAATTNTSPKGIGSDIYQQSQDPVSGKLPDTQPVANPINGAYNNPFQ